MITHFLTDPDFISSFFFSNCCRQTSSWSILHLIATNSISHISSFAGVSWSDGDGGPDPLHTESASCDGTHTWCLRVSGPSFQWPDCRFYFPIDEGAVEPGCRSASGVFHRHRTRLYITLCGRLVWQRGHRHFCLAVHLLLMGELMFIHLRSSKLTNLIWNE